MAIGTDILAAGQRLLTLGEVTSGGLAAALNGALNSFLPVRFRAIRARAATDDQVTAEFGAIIADTARISGGLRDEVPAEAMACVVDVHTTLSVEDLRESYERITQAKAIPKKEPELEGDFQPTSVTLGIIFAQCSTIPVERLASELERLNREHPSGYWPDILFVLDRGITHFVLRFPGEDEMFGFLPPAQGVSGGIPAYIHLIVHPGGPHALNRMLSVLLPHVGTYSTGLDIGHQLKDILIDAPEIGVTAAAYQFDVAAQLQPVPEDLYITGKLSVPVPLQIESQEGKVLGHLQFVPWQDGAYLRATGMPLAPFLLMLGNRNWLRTIQRSDSELSYVLPIKAADFKELVNRLQGQSNMVVRPPKPPRWMLAKAADEGTSSPFIARLFAGMLNLRDQVFKGEERRQFDQDYEPVLSSLESAREAANQITVSAGAHREKLTSGSIITINDGTLTITESIDRVLRKEIDSFLNTGYRALKDRQQQVMRRLGIDISFLYQKESAFLRGIETLRTQHPELADYLCSTRFGWSERFITTRNTIHSDWTLSLVEYLRTENSVKMKEPVVSEQPISKFVVDMLDSLLCFIEETTAYGLKTQLPSFMALREIPLAERHPVFPQRFQITLANGGMPLWHLKYHESRFHDA